MANHFEDFVNKNSLSADERFALIGYIEYHSNDYFSLQDNINMIFNIDIDIQETENISKSFFEQYSKG